MSIQGPNSLIDARASTFPTTHTSPPAAVEPISPVPAATATVSPWAELLSKLQQLHARDPAAFNHVVGQMTERVQTEAGRATGDEKQSLTKLGEQLAQLAKTGEMSVFRPTHHHHRAPAAHSAGKVPSILQTLLDQIDHVLGPGATPASPSG
jgi:hypothetical protein